MEKFEASHFSNGKNREGTGEMNRRQFLKIFGISAVSAAVIGSDLKMLAAQTALEYNEESRYEKHGWFYTLEEMEKIYDAEYNAPEKLIKNTFWREGEKWMGVIGEKKFEVPREFIDRTLKQFKEMLEQRTAKFLFRLDSFHGHFFADEKRYNENYIKLSVAEQTRKLFNDPELGVLYHNSEHGEFLVQNADKLTDEEKELKEKRNVIGWYDSRPIKILPLPEGGKKLAAEVPGHNLGPGFTFAAHKDGAFIVSANGQEIHLDISFDDGTYY